MYLLISIYQAHVVFGIAGCYAEVMPLSLSADKPQITNFLLNHSVGVLATCSKEGAPYAAAIYFIIDQNLNIYFVSKQNTKKVANISENNHVSLAVYDQQSQTTVQIAGTATKVEDQWRFDDIFQRVLAVTARTSESRVPPISKIAAGPYEIFCISPSSIRLASYTKPEHGQPHDIFDTVDIPEA